MVYKNSMIVYGGTSDNGSIHTDMLVFNFEDSEWRSIKFNGPSGN